MLYRAGRGAFVPSCCPLTQSRRHRIDVDGRVRGHHRQKYERKFKTSSFQAVLNLRSYFCLRAFGATSMRRPQRNSRREYRVLHHVVVKKR